MNSSAEVLHFSEQMPVLLLYEELDNPSRCGEQFNDLSSLQAEGLRV
jgi:hypothetical protein